MFKRQIVRPIHGPILNHKWRLLKSLSSQAFHPISTSLPTLIPVAPQALRESWGLVLHLEVLAYIIRRVHPPVVTYTELSPLISQLLLLRDSSPHGNWPSELVPRLFVLRLHQG